MILERRTKEPPPLWISPNRTNEGREMSKVSGQATMSAAVALSISVISSTASAEDIGKATSSGLDGSRLTYTRLYCTPDNESHFAELRAELAKQNFTPPAASIYVG